MNKKIIFTALALGGAIVIAARKMMKNKKGIPGNGRPKMSGNLAAGSAERT